MTNALAKQLKEAGFPQNPNGHNERPDSWFGTDGELQDWYVGDDFTEYYNPTLSELIEACGVAFSELNKVTHTKEPANWAAVSYSCEECGLDNMHSGYGKTPEEAVAMLWLDLSTEQPIQNQ